MALLHHEPTVGDDEVVVDREPRPIVQRKNSMGQTLRTVVATVCVLAVAAFMVLNTDDTRVDLGFDNSFEAPLWATVGIAAALGLVLGLAVGHRRCGRQHVDAS